MRFSRSEREDARGSLRSFLEATIGPADLRASAAEAAPCAGRIWKGLSELGWLGLTVDAQYGGLGLDFGDLEVLYEELGRLAAPAFPAGVLVAAEAIDACGDHGLKAKWLPRIVAGEVRVALRADFGFDRHGVKATYVGDARSNVVASLRRDGGRVGLNLREISQAVSGAPAIDLTRRLFEASAGDEGDTVWLAPEKVERAIDHAALALAGDSVGGSAFILEATVGYLGVRKQFGRVIGSFQALKHRAADWKVLLEASRALAGAAFASDDPPDASGVKAYLCDAYAAIAGDAVQLHGGIGFTWEHACHIYLKRAKLNQALFGGATAQLDRAARKLFDGELHV